eukprot:TRINITY_DN46797_c0_g1_i1.p1 TRINITY_DN46797_c0_g1~~TRINITY_DN46797_c0_g1_i1.p1  ORF type:complete len:312 (-),score=12.79 TRINITY_DN46797_c0_g1_i1:498-1433(-)
MVRATEFRITMPLSLEEYRIGQTYMRSRMQMESTTGNEGVEVIASNPFTDDKLGSGHFSHVIYHFASKAPAWLRALAPHGSLKLEEQNWNAYPHSKTVLRCPYFAKFKITIESMHVEDRGDSENALGLDADVLRLRKVERLDIASHERDMWSRMIAKSGVDPSKLPTNKRNRGPLAPGWQSSCNPVMTAYKMVSVEAPYWGFGKRLELFVLSGERALFLEAHRKCFGWMDEWCELTVDDVRRIERENIDAMRKNLVLHNKVAPAEDDVAADVSDADDDEFVDAEEGEESSIRPEAASGRATASPGELSAKA